MSIDYRRFPVLCVDDDRASLVAMRYALEEQFSIITASTGEEALRKLIQQDVAVLLADQRMPGMTGVEVCERARLLKPHVVRIIVTAYADLDMALEAINRGQVARYLRKPWTEDELRGTLKTSIDVVHLQRLMAEVELRLLRGDEAALTVTARLRHDINQQLLYLNMTMEKARRIAQDVTDPALQAQLGEVARSGESYVGHVNELLRRAQELAEGRAAQWGVADASRVVDMVMMMVRPDLSRRAQNEALLDSKPQVALPSVELAQVLLNLLTNACQAVPEGEPHKHKVSLLLKVEQGFAVFTVRDSGQGIPPDHIQKIFEDGFTTKPEAEGAGLGLSIVKTIVQRRGGKIDVQSEPGRTELVVRLPLVPE